MTTEAAAVLTVLPTSDGPVRSKRIARIVGFAWRQVVDAVRELRTRHGILVGSSSDGYWLIETVEEARATRARLVGKLKGTRETIDAIDAAWPQLAQGRLLEVT